MRFSFEDFDFASLTAAERLLLAQELLDSVFDEVATPGETSPFSAEQMGEIRRRAADADAGIAVGETWATVRARLDNR